MGYFEKSNNYRRQNRDGVMLSSKSMTKSMRIFKRKSTNFKGILLLKSESSMKLVRNLRRRMITSTKKITNKSTKTMKFLRT